jgi:Bifunctional DNA primase/polymerase, N-terminal
MSSDPSILVAASKSQVFAELFPRLAIFPLRPIVQTSEGPRCTCSAGAACDRLGKHPDVRWSQVEANEKAWTNFRGEIVYGIGYGIATGVRSGVFVIDLDGFVAIRAFYAMGVVPRTFTVRRGPDRGHLYFNRPGFRVRTTAGVLAPGVDVRGDGGFVVAPGSPHKSGDTYEIADDVAVVDAPKWLLELPGLRQPKVRLHESSSVELQRLEVQIGTRVPRAWRIERARAWLATQPSAVSGKAGHNATMRALACAVRENLLTDSDMIIEAISDWNARCEPPWQGSDLEHKVFEVMHRSTVPWSTTLDMHYALATRGAA